MIWSAFLSKLFQINLNAWCTLFLSWREALFRFTHGENQFISKNEDYRHSLWKKVEVSRTFHSRSVCYMQILIHICICENKEKGQFGCVPLRYPESFLFQLHGSRQHGCECFWDIYSWQEQVTCTLSFQVILVFEGSVMKSDIGKGGNIYVGRNSQRKYPQSQHDADSQMECCH